MGWPIGAGVSVIKGCAITGWFVGVAGIELAFTQTAVVLAQLVRPGLPIIYCGRLAMMEPRTGISVWGGMSVFTTLVALLIGWIIHKFV